MPKLKDKGLKYNNIHKLKDKGLKYNNIHRGNIWLTHVDHDNFYFDLKVYFYCF